MRPESDVLLVQNQTHFFFDEGADQTVIRPRQLLILKSTIFTSCRTSHNHRLPQSISLEVTG
jgi:hypothetical protein